MITVQEGPAGGHEAGPASRASGAGPRSGPDEERAARHRALALQALRCGRGINWAADITTLPIRLVARVAAIHGIADTSTDEGLPAAAQWPPVAVVTQPVSAARRAATPVPGYGTRLLQLAGGAA